MGLSGLIVEKMRALSGADLAKLLGVNRTVPSQWAGRGCPRNPDGSYRLDAVVEWLRASAAKPMGQDGLNPLDAEMLRWRSAKADVAELSRDKMKGLLIETAEAERVYGQFVSMVNQRLRSIGRSVADRLLFLEEPRDAEAIVQSEINGALEILADAPASNRVRKHRRPTVSPDRNSATRRAGEIPSGALGSDR